MREKIIFDAVINANNAISIPSRTRIKHDLEKGSRITVQIIDVVSPENV